MELIVGMGEYILSDQQEDVIKTFSLASCVGITVYIPGKNVAGMLHVVLPTPLEKRGGLERPGYFATTGVPLFINAACQKSDCRKEDLRIQIFGGADSKASQDIFHIGRKNIEAVKESLSGMNLIVINEDLRGHESRTLEMEVKSGEIRIYRQPL